MILNEWLEKIKKVHTRDIEMGLERISVVARSMGIRQPIDPIITVGGTNGKGSTVRGLEKIYLSAGYKVGAFTSPYLFMFNELIRVQGKPVEDEPIISAFEKIERYRNGIPLTQFEFNTLAALEIFQSAALEVWILEVGLGGRLDAVNIMDADLAIVTSIDIDHAAILGDTREKIAIEKAGIYRKEKWGICGDLNPPHTLIEQAKKIGTTLYYQGKDYGFEKKNNGWDWWSKSQTLKNLPTPKLALQNMSTVLMAIELLKEKLPVKKTTIEQALQDVTLTGRLQVIPGEVPIIMDVSHNPAAATWLANFLKERPIAGKTYAVFSMLNDKDIAETLRMVKPEITQWYIAELDSERATPLKILEEYSKAANISYQVAPSIAEAYKAAINNAHPGDRIVVFGSFYTVAGVIQNTCL